MADITLLTDPLVSTFSINTQFAEMTSSLSTYTLPFSGYSGSILKISTTLDSYDLVSQYNLPKATLNHFFEKGKWHVCHEINRVNTWVPCDD